MLEVELHESCPTFRRKPLIHPQNSIAEQRGPLQPQLPDGIRDVRVSGTPSDEPDRLAPTQKARCPIRCTVLASRNQTWDRVSAACDRSELPFNAHGDPHAAADAQGG